MTFQMEAAIHRVQNSKLALNLKTHDKRGRNHFCQKCDKSFLRREYLLKHIKYIHENSEAGKWICHICKKEFAQNGSLIIHVKNHENKDFYCNTCGNKYTNLVSLKNHIRKHHEQKDKYKSKCDICNVEVDKKQLESHMTKHTGFKTYQCSYCEKDFAQKQTLKLHEKLHMGIKHGYK